MMPPMRTSRKSPTPCPGSTPRHSTPPSPSLSSPTSIPPHPPRDLPATLRRAAPTIQLYQPAPLLWLLVSDHSSQSPHRRLPRLYLGLASLIYRLRASRHHPQPLLTLTLSPSHCLHQVQHTPATPTLPLHQLFRTSALSAPHIQTPQMHHSQRYSCIVSSNLSQQSLKVLHRHRVHLVDPFRLPLKPSSRVHQHGLDLRRLQLLP